MSWSEYDRLSDESQEHSRLAAHHATEAVRLLLRAREVCPPGPKPTLGDLFDVKRLQHDLTVADIVGGDAA